MAAPKAMRLTQARRLSSLARFGLVARGFFYLMLVYLVAQLAATGGGSGNGTGGGGSGSGSGKQANAHGALTTIASHPGGLAAIAATALGFFAFGTARMWGAIRDEPLPGCVRPHDLRRLFVSRGKVSDRDQRQVTRHSNSADSLTRGEK